MSWETGRSPERCSGEAGCLLASRIPIGPWVMEAEQYSRFHWLEAQLQEHPAVEQQTPASADCSPHVLTRMRFWIVPLRRLKAIPTGQPDGAISIVGPRTSTWT